MEQHLAHRPTRSERQASTRAAHRYVAGSNAQLVLLPAAVGDHARRVLVLARPGLDLDDFVALRRVVAQSRRPDKPQGRLTKDMVQHVESLQTKVSSAARSGRIIPVERIEPAHARLLAEDLIESVADLNNLAAALVRRSRRRTPTQPETDPGVVGRLRRRVILGIRSLARRPHSRTRPLSDSGYALPLDADTFRLWFRSSHGSLC